MPLPSVIRTIIWVLGLAVCALVISTAINKPPTTDEVEFASAALATAHTARPVYYLGNLPTDAIPPVPPTWHVPDPLPPGYQYGLWHPSLQVNLIALSYRLFGPRDWAGRLPGLFCYLVTLILLNFALRRHLPPGVGDTAATILALLYLTSPMLLQEGIMLDIDNTSMTACCALFLCEFLRLRDGGANWKQRLYLIALLALALWSKEFAEVYLSAATLPYLVLRRAWRRILPTLGIFAAGTLLFAMTWWVYCQALHLPASYFVHFTLQAKLASGEGTFLAFWRANGLADAGSVVGYTLMFAALWLSPFFLLLWFASIGLRKCWHEPLSLVALFALVVAGASILYRPSFMILKYEYPAWVAATAVIAAYLARIIAKPLRPVILLALIGMLALMLAAAQVLISGDAIPAMISDGMKGLVHQGYFRFLAIVALVAIGTMLWLGPRMLAAHERIALGLLTACLGGNLALNFLQLGPGVTSLSWNNYEEMGLRDAADYLLPRLQADDVPILRKDVGNHIAKDLPYPTLRWLAADRTWTLPDDQLAQVLRSPRTRWVVMDPLSARFGRTPLVEQLYRLQATFGDFHVYRQREDILR